MNFQQFAEQHGLVIDSLILDRWVRVPTTDHPRKKNGAYIYDGRGGAIINFAMHEHHITFRSDEPYKPDPMMAERRRQAEQNRLKQQQAAADKAAFILKSSTLAPHPYLKRKGFDDAGYVWRDSLIIPMRVGRALVGCQLIAPDGVKRFLKGQRTKGAELVIDNKGRDILVEGFATGLSVRRALKHARQRYRIHVCFSAGNMLEIAKTVRDPLVIADNDPMGVKVAEKIASDFWIGLEGEDFNDAEARAGTAAVADSLMRFFSK